VENILKVFRVDFVYSFEKHQDRQGIRFSLPFLLSGGREN
jgi:hypothetical protein